MGLPTDGRTGCAREHLAARGGRSARSASVPGRSALASGQHRRNPGSLTGRALAMSDAASMTPQRARGGRARRQREAQRVDAVIAGIERKIPTYELLDEEGLACIEAVADAILQEVGMDFRGDDDALRLWREAGAELEGERVRFPAGLLRSVLKTAPSPSSSMRAIPSARSGSAAIPSSSRPPTGLRSCRISRAAGAMGRSPISRAS